jgi:hypothetical protein
MNKLSIFILIIFFLGLISCGNSLDPLDKGTGTYTIYGAFNLREQPNYIRVRDINAPFTKAATEPIDGKVLLYNFGTDSVAVLEDQIVEYFDLYHHNFEYSENITPNTKYRVTVERSDGASRVLNMTTPTKPDPIIAPVNQECEVPVNFEMGPLNGSTVVVSLGYPPGKDSLNTITENTEWKWGPKYIFESDEGQLTGEVTFTFIPDEQLRLIHKFYRFPTGICREYLKTGYIFLKLEHYGPGFYEDITSDTLDIMKNQRFGGFYYDTLLVLVDTLPNQVVLSPFQSQLRGSVEE